MRGAAKQDRQTDRHQLRFHDSFSLNESNVFKISIKRNRDIQVKRALAVNLVNCVCFSIDTFV